LKDFNIAHTIGTGSSAIVKLAFHKKTKQKVAVKIYDKYKMKESYIRKAFKGEVDIMKQMSHPSIVKLYCVIDEPKTVNVVMEHVSGVSMQVYLKNKNMRK
jgi:serine/threonine protein kinase